MGQNVKVKDFLIGEGQKLAVISGPCVIESEKAALEAAAELKAIFSKHPSLNFIFKSSYDKANRSSIKSFRGPGINQGLKILAKIKEELDLPILTDVHTPKEADAAAEVVDIIQIPAFLCRQTDLVTACAKTQAVVNIKKGQFLAPWDIKNVVDKITGSGNTKIIITERGVSFGYNNLISDMRAIPVMKKLGFPVCFDATHSVQLPGGLKDSTGGEKEFVPTLAKAAIASGANALFIETHPDPSNAKSDGANMLDFTSLKQLLKEIEKLYNVMLEIG